jgi:hypothetical protein
MLEPIPVAPRGPRREPLACLSAAEVVEECRYVDDSDPSWLEEIYRRLDREGDTVWAVDLDRVVCPYLPICDPIVNQEVVKFDNTHLTVRFARSVAPAIEGYLTRSGIIEWGG